MSDSKSPVTWRLNDLLEAGKRAKEFASSPMQKSVEAIETTDFSLTSYESAHELKAVVEDSREIELETSVEVVDSTDQTVELQDTTDDSTVLHPDDLNEENYKKIFEESESFKKKLEESRLAGIEEGMEMGKELGKKEWEDSTELLNQFVENLRVASEDKSQYFDPLKRLSIHIAKHLVKGELSISGLAIERLVHEVLNFVERNSSGVIVVYMNVKDKKKYEEVAALDQQLELRVDPDLSQGSLRLSFDDSGIEDLIENRLSSLSNLVINQSDGWRSGEEKLNTERTVDVMDGETEVFEGELMMETSEVGKTPLGDKLNLNRLEMESGAAAVRIDNLSPKAVAETENEIS